jgi:hypothetical protein
VIHPGKFGTFLATILATKTCGQVIAQVAKNRNKGFFLLKFPILFFSSKIGNFNVSGSKN